MNNENYECLQEAKIQLAWEEAHEAMAKNDFIVATAEEHIKQLSEELSGKGV